jgi:hypothetical protein
MANSQLINLLNEGFRQRAWHGTNLLGSIRGLEPGTALWRPALDRHNIWELIVHCAYWKYAVTRMLTGAKRGSFAYEGSNFFTRDSGTSHDLKRDIRLLRHCHRELVAAAARVKPGELAKKAPSSRRWTREQAIRGAACHDVYHAGQIQLLKRLREG